MTDPSQHSPLAALGTGPVYENVQIWLPQLFAEQTRTGATAIEGKTFVNCRFQGPAVLLPLSGCTFDTCNMGEAGGDRRNLLLAPVGSDKVTGVIPFRDCVFRQCAFYMVGFTGPPAFLKQFHEMVGGPAS